MAESPVTRPTLILRIRDAADERAWGEFVEIYAPLIHAYALKRGLQDADAADLTQDVLHKVSGHAGKFEYDPKRGTFRGWLLTVTLNHLRNFIARKSRKEIGSGKTEMVQLLDNVPSREEEALWNQQHQWHVFVWAAKKARTDFREQTWEAFRLVAMEGKAASDTAAQLGLSVGAVHIAKSRVLSRIKEIITELEGDTNY